MVYKVQYTENSMLERPQSSKFSIVQYYSEGIRALLWNSKLNDELQAYFILIPKWFLATVVKKNLGSTEVMNDIATTFFSDKRQISDRKILRPPFSYSKTTWTKIFFFTTVVKGFVEWITQLLLPPGSYSKTQEDLPHLTRRTWWLTKRTWWLTWSTWWLTRRT